jgi:Anaerobic C4-dicarboxylate transporter
MLAVTIPSTFIAVLIGAMSVAWRGPRLSEDVEYQRRLTSGEIKLPEAMSVLHGTALRNARGSTWLFLAGITVVVLMGVFPVLRPYSVAGSEWWTAIR